MKKLISALLILTMIVSMVCVSTSAAGVHINANMESISPDEFSNQFKANAFFLEAGLLYGYDEARALESLYESDDDTGVFKNTLCTWLTYDMSVSLQAIDDELSERDRSVCLVYCNDNMKYNGLTDSRLYMTFLYDITNGCFRFTEGIDTNLGEGDIMDPVYREVDVESDFCTLGMSIDKNRIRCFFNDELIYDFQDTAGDYLIAKEINSPFLYWQGGNFTQINNITVADAGFLFPYADEPVTSETTAPAGDDNVTEVTTTKETTTRVETSVVVKEDGQTEIVTEVITEATTPAPAATNTGKPAGGSSASTGDATFVVIAAMIATLGCALIVRKVNAR